uniref:RNA-directed DNA polymerase n=1 Tax=Trichogramma kaykai TaxID=54128 RepID=A0ABD2WX54_9HYME
MLFDKNRNKNFEENIEEINNENYDKNEIKELFMIGTLLEKDLPEEVAFFENFDDSELSFVNERIIHINDSYEVNANNNCDYDKFDENERFDKLLKALRIEYNQSKELNKIIDLIREYADIFHLKGETLGATHIIEHAIHTKDDAPINARPYRFPAALREELHRQVNEMLETGIMETSESPYRSNIFLVLKPPDKEGNKRYRLVVDFRQLNEKTIPDRYPLPNILDIIDQVGGSKYFSTLDLSSGFYQCMLRPEDRHKTAFSTNFDLFQFRKMPMGLCNSPATFQRAMDRAFKGLQGHDLFLYLDDCVIFAKSEEEHFDKLKRFFQRTREVNLKLQPEKCKFFENEVVYLGHVLNSEGVQCDPKKLEAVKNFPTPKNVKNIRQFLGLCGYYRRFIKNFAGIAKPLTELQKKDTEFCWNEERQIAFDTLKAKLCEKPILQIADPKLPYVVTCDASGYAIGGFLAQSKNGLDLPIGYVSRMLTDTERRYDTYSREALEIVFTIEKFKPYLLGNKFTVYTDHKPLLYFRNSKDPNSRVSRYQFLLSAMDFDIQYKPGRANAVADCLSRNPIVESLKIMLIKKNKNQLITMHRMHLI